MPDVVHSATTRPMVPTKIALLAVVLLATLPALTGCTGFFHKKTGDIMSSYAGDHMVPYMMGSSDLSMACETGVSMGAFLMSFERVTDPPRKAAMVTLVSAGMCAEADAWEADLRQLRAIRDGRASDARDARITEQRYHAVAAQRLFTAYNQAGEYFGTLGEGCPEFEEGDELFYLLGLSAGMLALVHDRGAEGMAGVPMDLPHQVARAASCLDNERWWGGPLALEAAVWAMVPGAAPEGNDPWDTLAAASELGEASGVRLARAFEVQILDIVGRDDEARVAIAAHAASLESTPSDPDWALLDSYATRMILHISDRAWTNDRGHRTPLGALGTFYQPPVEIEEYDDLFDDLLSDPDDDSGEEASDADQPEELE